jgi:hypothetical protein
VKIGLLRKFGMGMRQRFLLTARRLSLERQVKGTLAFTITYR